MRLYRVSIAIIASVVTISCGGGGGGATGVNTSSMIDLGSKIFFDVNLSSGSNQSCGTCHDPANGFADPRVSVIAPVSEGSVASAFGDRNAPTAAYTSFSPSFGLASVQLQPPEETASKYQGGQFLDGRALNLIEQAKAPFTNPVEMNLTEADVVNKVKNSSYAADFLSVFGANAFDNTMMAYNNIAAAIAAFEASSTVNKFTSKFDAYLAGQYTMTASEQRGFDLFTDPNSAKCANCHTVGEVGDPPEESLFTNFKYYNVGTPVNFNYPPLVGSIDYGLGASDKIDPGDQLLGTENGKFKVPTLRNIELTAPYMHNGAHATLEEVIQHYDTFATGIIPEVDANIALEMGDLVNGIGLNLDPANDYPDLVNFMNTLTDGYM